MAKKIESIGNYFVMTDTVTNKVEIREPKIEVKIQFQNDIVIIYTEAEENSWQVPKGDFVDSGDAAFGSDDLLLEFLMASTGFSSPEVTGQTLSTTLEDYISLEGTLASKPITGQLEVAGAITGDDTYSMFYQDESIIQYIAFDTDSEALIFGMKSPTINGNSIINLSSNEVGIGASAVNGWDNSYIRIGSGTDTNNVSVDCQSISMTKPLTLSRGLTSSYDYTPNITELDFTQKKYVDDAIINSAGVPYTGATSDVDLGVNNFTASLLNGMDIRVAANYSYYLGEFNGINNIDNYNTSLGYYTLYNSSGESNVGIGENSLNNNVGGWNVGIGSGAGLGNTSDESVMIGNDAGVDNVGSQVVGIGRSALNDNSAQFAIGIGWLAGKNNSGTDAIFLGQSAGVNNTYSNVVGIGKNATPTAPNQIVLGDSNITEVLSSGTFKSTALLTSITDAKHLITKEYLEANPIASGLQAVVDISGFAESSNTKSYIDFALTDSSAWIDFTIGDLTTEWSGYYQEKNWLGLIVKDKGTNVSSEVYLDNIDGLVLKRNSSTDNYTKITLTSATKVNNIIFPDDGGEVALTKNVIPYTGATADVDLGSHNVTTSGQYNLSSLNTAPSSATDTGTLGEVRVTATAIYVCTATDTWVKADLATW